VWDSGRVSHDRKCGALAPHSEIAHWGWAIPADRQGSRLSCSCLLSSGSAGNRVICEFLDIGVLSQETVPQGLKEVAEKTQGLAEISEDISQGLKQIVYFK